MNWYIPAKELTINQSPHKILEQPHYNLSHVPLGILVYSDITVMISVLQYFTKNLINFLPSALCKYDSSTSRLTVRPSHTLLLLEVIRAERSVVSLHIILEYSCNKYSNLIGQLEVHYFTYGPRGLLSRSNVGVLAIF